MYAYIHYIAQYELWRRHTQIHLMKDMMHIIGSNWWEQLGQTQSFPLGMGAKKERQWWQWLGDGVKYENVHGDPDISWHFHDISSMTTRQQPDIFRIFPDLTSMEHTWIVPGMWRRPGSLAEHHEPFTWDPWWFDCPGSHITTSERGTSPGMEICHPCDQPNHSELIKNGGFLKMGVPPNHEWYYGTSWMDFPWNKPSSYWGTPHDYGNLQIRHCWTCFSIFSGGNLKSHDDRQYKEGCCGHLPRKDIRKDMQNHYGLLWNGECPKSAWVCQHVSKGILFQSFLV